MEHWMPNIEHNSHDDEALMPPDVKRDFERARAAMGIRMGLIENRLNDKAIKEVAALLNKYLEGIDVKRLSAWKLRRRNKQMDSLKYQRI